MDEWMDPIVIRNLQEEEKNINPFLSSLNHAAKQTMFIKRMDTIKQNFSKVGFYQHISRCLHLYM